MNRLRPASLGCLLIALVLSGCRQPAPPEFNGEWELTMPRGFTYRSPVTQLTNGQFAIPQIVALSGVYELRRDQLVIVQPTNPRLSELVWLATSPDRLVLVAAPAVEKIGSDYRGATLQRLSGPGLPVNLAGAPTLEKLLATALTAHAQMQAIETERQQTIAHLNATDQERNSVPFNLQQAQLLDALAHDNARLADALWKYLRTPPDRFPGLRLYPLQWRSAVAEIRAEWVGDSGQPVATAALLVRPAAGAATLADKPKLAGQFPILLASSTQFWVRCGTFEIRFTPVQDELKNEATLPAVVTEFFDLEGLARLKPAGK